jgi:transcriptional regulator with XRE-family HTH domain
MSTETVQLIATVKRQLKARGLTYRDVARALKISEASVKRVFSSERFTVARLAQVSQLLGFTLAELLQESTSSLPPLDTLSLDQERQLMSDDKLLLVAVCALNHWSLEDILRVYDVPRAEVVKRLRILDGMGILELLPGDRIRRRAKRDFDWLANGPIRSFFSNHGLADFLSGPFDPDDESLDFSHGMLTRVAQAELKLEMRRLRSKLVSLHEQSIPAPLADKSGIGLLLAIRGWEPAAFRRLRRDAPAGAAKPMNPRPEGASLAIGITKKRS